MEEGPEASFGIERQFVMETNAQPSFLKRLLSGGLSFVLVAALVPAVAIASPATAEAVTPALEVEVTRVNTGKITLAKGMSYKLGAAATNGAKITYRSSNKSVVSVSSKGTIRINKIGKATITVTATLGKKKDTEKISVTSVKPSKYVAVKKIKMSLSDSNLRVGESAKATVTFTPKNASNKNVIYKSSNPSVLTVGSKGVVTSVGEGRATISVTSCANKKAKATLKASVAAAEESGEQPEQPSESEPTDKPDQPSQDGGDTPSYPSWGGGSNSGGSDNPSAAPTVIPSESIEIDDGYDSKVTYAEGVKVISGADYSFTTNSLGIQTITIASSSAASVSTIESGDIIVLEPTETNPGGCVVTVGSVSAENGTVTVTGTIPAAQDVFEDIDVQGISTTVASFEPAEGVEVVNEASSTMKLRAKKPAGTESIDMGTLTLKIPDVEFGSGAKATVEVKFEAAAEYIVKGLGKDMLAYVGLNQKSSLVGSIETKNYLDKNDRGDIRLGTIKFPTEVPGMFIAVNLFAVLDAKGSVEIAFSSTGDIGWLYKDRKHQMVASLKQGCDGVKVEGKLKAGFDFDLSLDILSKRIIDAAFGLGENLKGSFEVRPTTMICCEAEIGAYGSLSVGKHSALEDFGISYELEIDLGDYFPSMNVNAHFEIPAGLKGFFNKVDKCTWGDTSEKPGGGEAGGGSGGGAGSENTPSEDSGVYGDFNYVIQDGHYGYGAYATYAGEGGNVTVPEKMGGQYVVSVDCSYKGLTALDVSKCSGLRELWCDHNDIANLNVTNCPNLQVLECSWNNLTSLDVTKCTLLTNLYCVSKNSVWGSSIDIVGGPRLTKLDVSKCSELREFWCRGNDLTELDLANCTNLSSLDCSDNKLTVLDVTKCIALTKLRCWNNQIATLDLSKCRFLQELFCGENKIKSLDLSNCPNIVWVNCQMQNAGQNNAGSGSNRGYLEYLNIQGCANLIELICSDNSLASLDCSGFTALTRLDVSFNNLSSLSVQGCAALKDLNCTQNGDRLNTLDVSDCKNLECLLCSYNYELKTLDVSECTKLVQLACNGIGLTSLDVSKNTNLVFLYCNWNTLSALDVSNCQKLIELDCSANNLIDLNVAGCPQLEILDCTDNDIEALDVSNCQKLHELQCDDSVVVSWYQTA